MSVEPRKRFDDEVTGGELVSSALVRLTNAGGVESSQESDWMTRRKEENWSAAHSSALRVQPTKQLDARKGGGLPETLAETHLFAPFEQGREICPAEKETQ